MRPIEVKIIFFYKNVKHSKNLQKFFTENAPDSDLVIEKVIEFGIDFLGGEWKNVKKNEVKVTTIL